MLTNTKNKHLTRSDRNQIQDMLEKHCTFKEIGDAIGKHPSSISKEIRRNIYVTPATVTKTDSNGNKLAATCDKLSKPPYVCNTCPERKRCRLERHFYYGNKAQTFYEELLHSCREGIPLNKSSFYELDSAVTEGVKKGQHIYQIITSSNLQVSMSTIYRYIHKGYMSFPAMDLPRLVKFKARKHAHRQGIPTKIRQGRTYSDYKAYMELHPDFPVMEMDTVIGRIGGKTIMTWIFSPQNFMVGFLLDGKTSAEVTRVFDEMKDKCIKNNVSFKNLVPVILTDNGSEFADVFSMETNHLCEKELSVFFCDPSSPWQKPHVEKNHTLLRDICPKGTSFDNLTQEKVNLIFSHVNSVSRKEFNGKSSYEMFEFAYGEKITSLFDIKKIPSNEVIQSPALLKK